MAKGQKRPRSDSEDSDDSHQSDDKSVEPQEEKKITNKTRRIPYTNKQRVLIIASRGITARYRHLLEDLKALIPHHKKDNKLDDKNDIQAVNEIAEMKSCNQIVYLETRKHQDMYLYVGKALTGPSIKFHVVNVHTMDELKLTGNCMIGSRPLLDFDAAFDSSPHFQLMKQLLADTFGVPQGHPKSKPFLDRVMCFYLVKNNIWVRNYQIVYTKEHGSNKETHLVEIGPRFVLIPIKIFMGSLGGPTLYSNQAFVSPNTERAAAMKGKSNKYVERIEQNARRKEYLEQNKMPADELSDKNIFR